MSASFSQRGQIVTVRFEDSVVCVVTAHSFLCCKSSHKSMNCEHSGLVQIKDDVGSHILKGISIP